MNKQLADMVRDDLRAARESHGRILESLDKMVALPLEEVIGEENEAAMIKACRACRSNAERDDGNTALLEMILKVAARVES